MKNITKFLLLAFLIENLCTKTVLLYQYTAPVFYAFLGIGILTLFYSKRWPASSYGRFDWMIFISLIYTFHCFILGYEFFCAENLLYLGAKIATFLIICTSLNSNSLFFEKKGIVIFAVLAAIMILQGLLFPRSDVVFNGEERVSFGFVNSNSLGGTACIVFGVLIFEFQNQKWKKWAMIACAVAVFAVFACGSRASLLVLAILFFARYKVTGKTITLVVIGTFIALLLLPNMGIELTGVNRIAGTVSGEIGNNRDLEREAAEWMIKERPMLGWGLVTENKGAAAEMTQMSSHNGYLDLAKTLGLPMAILWLLIVLWIPIKYFANMKRLHLPVDFFCVYAFCALIKCMYEPMFAGVHEVECNMFYVSLAIMSMRLYDSTPKKKPYQR